MTVKVWDGRFNNFEEKSCSIEILATIIECMIYQQKLISYKNVVKKNDNINLPWSQDLNVQQIYLNLPCAFPLHFHNSKTHASSLLVCCIFTCPISWCTSHFLHWTNLVVSWLFGSFQASAAQHLPFPNYENCMFSLGKRTGPVLCRDLILLITQVLFFLSFLFGV
jgi:hypothetical protein